MNFVDHLHQRCVSDLWEQLLDIRIEPKRILLLSARPAILRKLINERFTQALIVQHPNQQQAKAWIEINHTDNYDLVISDNALGYGKGQVSELSQLCGYLRPGGLFACYFFSRESWECLQALLRSDTQGGSIGDWPDMHDFGDWLHRARLEQIVCQSDRLQIVYARKWRWLCEAYYFAQQADMQVFAHTDFAYLRKLSKKQFVKWGREILIKTHESTKIIEKLEIAYAHGWKMQALSDSVSEVPVQFMRR